MEILIIGFTKIKYMPYLNLYFDCIDLDSNNVHIITWNRDLEKDSTFDKRITIHEFRKYQEDDVVKWSKILNFTYFRKFVKRMMIKRNYDLVVVLHSLPAVLLFDILTTKYRKKYIFDYRDCTYESNKIFKELVAKISQRAHMTLVSSDAYRINLPNVDNIYTTHNLSFDSLKHRVDYGIRIDPIRIAFWGLIRHPEINKKIIDHLFNDTRFELHYYGREQADARVLKEYIREKNANNVFFHGEYKPTERYIFAKETSILHNIYENDTTALALGNKFYDGMILYIPQLCNIGSYMGLKVEQAGVGIQCDPYNSDDFADQIYDYYTRLNRKEFIDKCDIELANILTEYQKSIDIIKASICI